MGLYFLGEPDIPIIIEHSSALGGLFNARNSFEQIKAGNFNIFSKYQTPAHFTPTQ